MTLRVELLALASVIVIEGGLELAVLLAGTPEILKSTFPVKPRDGNAVKV